MMLNQMIKKNNQLSNIVQGAENQAVKARQKEGLESHQENDKEVAAQGKMRSPNAGVRVQILPARKRGAPEYVVPVVPQVVIQRTRNVEKYLKIVVVRLDTQTKEEQGQAQVKMTIKKYERSLNASLVQTTRVIQIRVMHVVQHTELNL